MGTKNYNSWLMIAVLSSSFATSPLLFAQNASVKAKIEKKVLNSHDFDIPGGPLSNALLTFGQQSGLQLIAPSNLTTGLSSTGVKGKYQSDEALRALLSGTSLAFKYINSNTIEIYSVAVVSPKGTQVLGTVQVNGTNVDTATVDEGVNGSRDITATEGSNSLNGSILSVGSKGPTSIKETPQSVSVITQKAMQEEGIQNLNEAMQHATGITTQQNGNSRSMSFYSRGYQITNMQIDGGSPIDISGNSQVGYRFQPNFNMAEYDHVEVLRGADGLFNGSNGAGPGGVVNLVRKRPLDHYQAIWEGSVGSWDHYRNVLDVSSPLGFDGKVRGRTVLTWDKTHHFYKEAYDDNKSIFGTLEADLTPSTLLNIGGSYSQMRGVPFYGGLMMYANGKDSKLPRDTSYTFPWTKNDNDTLELFGSITQTFSDHWNGKINYTRLAQKNYNISVQGVSFGGIPLDGTRLGVSATSNRTHSYQDSLDATLNGQFIVWGLPQKITLGGNYQRIRSDITYPSDYDHYILPDDFTYDPFNWDYSYPKPNIPASNYALKGFDNLNQWGLYARIEITPWKPLHLITGLRLNSYRTEDLQYQSGVDANGNFGPQPYKTNSSGHSFESPYYAISYDINDNWSWYGSYTDVYSPQLDDIGLDGKAIGPITGSNYETGLKFAQPDGMLNASLSLYRSQRSGSGVQISESQVDLGGGRTGYYKNSTSPDISEGADLEISGTLKPWWQMTLGYTYNISHQGEQGADGKGKPLQTFIPKHIFKLWNDFHFNSSELLNRFQFGVGVRAQSASYVNGTYFDDESFELHPYRFKSSFYSVWSARVGYNINRNWNIALLADNLFDRRYYQTLGNDFGNYWYGEPRNFMLTLTGKFE
ncbi:TonB-dependent siderophore receptor [Marinomonas spartinae]|uniref:TonB-dependent siderophore receptor n=1 Tax=Marinomonas spartinae TaxID=1792290 RepID=UPI0018F1DB1B|nr:TonB-dependent receptor [Marinomonas spartinae]MBJ7556575.1 TonB-dependent siderophore receptor [Marinomonas spartinae]